MRSPVSLLRGSRRRAAIPMAVAALLGACTSQTAAPADFRPGTSPAITSAPDFTARADKTGAWTVFVYMAADNNLEDAALVDLEQMTKASGTQFVVLIDRAAGESDASVLDLGNFEDARLLRVLDGKVEILAQPGEINTGDPAVLTGFLHDGLAKYKGDHNGLVLWDHGGGWRGVAWDDSAKKDNLDLSEITSAVKDGLDGSGLDRLDLVGFDACLMATYEVGSALRPYATYMVASEEVEPGTGWDWSTLSTKGGATTKELGQKIIDGFVGEAIKGGETGTTLSMVDLTRFDEVDRAVANLGSAMESGAHTSVGQISSTRSATTGYGKAADPAKDYFLVDLGDLARGSKGTPAVAAAARELEAAVKSVVVAHRDGPLLAASTGLAAYFPPTRKLSRSAYDKVTSTPGWRAFLDAYLGGIESVATADLPLFTKTDRLLTEQDVVDTAEHVVLTADVTKGTGGNVADARLFWGEVDLADPTQVTFFGERNATVNKDTITGAYDWKSLTISDGTTTLPAYATLRVDGDGNTTRIVVPLDYQRGRASAPGDLYLTFANGKIVDETYYVRTGEGVSALTPKAGDSFIPLLKHQDLTTQQGAWQPVAGGRLKAGTAGLRFRYGPSDEIKGVMLGIGINDVAGNIDFVYYGTASGRTP